MTLCQHIAGLQTSPNLDGLAIKILLRLYVEEIRKAANAFLFLGGKDYTPKQTPHMEVEGLEGRLRTSM